MNNDLADLILSIDTRERETKRIISVKDFFESRGSCVEFNAITIKDGNQITSMDYSIEGSYKGKPVNLGISAKSLVDFSGNIGNLSNELARGYLRFDEVGLILITGCYETTLPNDSLHAVIRNLPAEAHNKDDRADILNTTSMFNTFSSWERSGIHCRQILYEEQFPQAVISILNFITKDHHEGLNFCTKAVSNSSEKAKMDFVNAHTHLGISGFGVKTALKLWDYLVEWNYPPNLHFASSLSEEDLIDALGTKTGKALYEVYRNRNGWIDVKKATKEANKSPPERKLPELKGNIPIETDPALNVFNYEFNNKHDIKIHNTTIKIVSSPFYDNVPFGTCGVYFVVFKNRHLYIGMSGDLRNRISNHNQRWNKYIEWIEYISCTSLIECKQLEKEMIKKYLPDLNTILAIPHKAEEILQSSTSTVVSHTDIPNISDIHVNDVGDKSQLSQVSKGKADELIVVSPVLRTAGNPTISEREPIDKPHCSRSADLDNKLQSSSAEHLELAKNRTCAQPSSASNGIIGTPDTLQSSEVSHTPIASVDTAEGTFLKSNPIPTCTPSAVHHQKETVKSLEDAIVDRVYSKPEIDTVIMREFMSRGFQMPEIHKVIKESSKLHKYKQGGDMMIAYKGVRADKEMDVGV